MKIKSQILDLPVRFLDKAKIAKIKQFMEDDVDVLIFNGIWDVSWNHQNISEMIRQFPLFPNSFYQYSPHCLGRNSGILVLSKNIIVHHEEISYPECQHVVIENVNIFIANIKSRKFYNCCNDCVSYKYDQVIALKKYIAEKTLVEDKILVVGDFKNDQKFIHDDDYMPFEEIVEILSFNGRNFSRKSNCSFSNFACEITPGLYDSLTIITGV